MTFIRTESLHSEIYLILFLCLVMVMVMFLHAKIDYVITIHSIYDKSPGNVMEEVIQLYI